MTVPSTLFEVSWEVCNKVGGIHTVVSTKAKTLVARLSDDYIAIGPWLLSGGQSEEVFEEEQGFLDFSERCRALGVPVRVGRWKIPGRPRTILVEFSGLFAKKDEILAGLWEHFRVDSLFGEWDYFEPVLFGHAAGIVIEAWFEEHVAPRRRAAVAQFHEWMTGSGMMYLKTRAPSIGTVFTTHATMLGRSISSTGKTPAEGLAGRTSDAAALAAGVRAKHSLESGCARESDVFTTVSQITADEAELFFGRRASPLLPNGIDLDVIDEIAGTTTREQAQVRLRELARRFLGEDASDAALVCISGRYEFHNKGIDLLLDALARLALRPGRRIVLFLLVPAGNSGLSRELIERLDRPPETAGGPIGVSTHNLFDPERDPIGVRARELGLDNRVGARVKLIQIPVYFHEQDGFLNLPYEAILRAMELTCFPSFYEPWGYTPEESLAVGVPTVTTDCAGFGRWASERELGPADGVFVLPRIGVSNELATENLVLLIDAYLREERDPDERTRICRRTARLTAWSDLIAHYDAAFDKALALAGARAEEPRAMSYRPKFAVPTNPALKGERPHLVRFDVATTMPRELAGLERLSRNFWWSWDPEATAVFQDLAPHRWDTARHNPVAFLRAIYPEDLRAKAADASYVARVKRVLERFDAYLAAAPTTSADGAITREHPVAYFCAEFGIHESLCIYSGGLGILAGDHLKSASDIGLPLIGMGLFYRMGFFEQRLTSTGEQIHGERENDPRALPLEALLDEHGEPLEITLQLPSSNLVLRAWTVAVGRVTLYLLDTNVPQNRPEDRDITRSLYGGDQETRLRQEIVLGRGGKRLLSRLGIRPSVFHINEGHAAFLSLERVAHLVKDFGLTFDEAREQVRATMVFTTHTPVPAGHDRFGEDLIRRYFSDVHNWAGVPWERFWQLGQCEDDRSSFNMTFLALNFCSFANGVSRLHGQVSRKLLHPFWPRLLENDVPVTSVTNGVHLPSWTDPALRAALGVSERALDGSDFAKGAARLEPRELWQIRSAAKQRMQTELRARIETAFVRRHDSPSLLTRMQTGIGTADEAANTLWIGFARRFAPYKRAQLLFRHPERLRALFEQAGRPLRIVFAGKAHPNDKHGQEILAQVVALTRREPFLGRVFFIEDYDIALARTLVQGVDVWLNNPIRPLEASGTSGMKVAANGGLNVSILDGWWIEGHDGHNGWSIGGGRVYPDQELQDEADSENLYRLLEEELLPLYFTRTDGLPLGWIERVKHSLSTLPVVFDTDRMVAEYRDRAYAPLASEGHALARAGCAGARELARREIEMRRAFGEVKVEAAHMADLSAVRVGDRIEARVDIALGRLSVEDVLVELVLGHTSSTGVAGGGGELVNPIVVLLEPVGLAASGARVYEGGHKTERSGAFAYGIRVRPKPGTRAVAGLADLVSWA